MKYKEKVRITEDIDVLDMNIFEGDLSVTIEELKDILDSATKKGFEKVFVEFHKDYYEDEYYKVKVFGERLETDEEVRKRLEKSKQAKVARKIQIEKQKAKKEEQERKLLESLKKKYEK